MNHDHMETIKKYNKPHYHYYEVPESFKNKMLKAIAVTIVFLTLSGFLVKIVFL